MRWRVIVETILEFIHNQWHSKKSGRQIILFAQLHLCTTLLHPRYAHGIVCSRGRQLLTCCFQLYPRCLTFSHHIRYSQTSFTLCPVNHAGRPASFRRVMAPLLHKLSVSLLPTSQSPHSCSNLNMTISNTSYNTSCCCMLSGGWATKTDVWWKWSVGFLVVDFVDKRHFTLTSVSLRPNLNRNVESVICQFSCRWQSQHLYGFFGSLPHMDACNQIPHGI